MDGSVKNLRLHVFENLQEVRTKQIVTVSSRLSVALRRYVLQLKETYLNIKQTILFD